MQEIARADDYGLRRPIMNYQNQTASISATSAAVDWLADAEIKINFAVLRYARDARGGRINPSRLTKNLEPSASDRSLGGLEFNCSSTGSRSRICGASTRVIRNLSPSPEVAGDKAQASTSQPSIIIPDGPVLKKGVEHDQVALLRKTA